MQITQHTPGVRSQEISIMFHRPKIKINFKLVSKIQFHIGIVAQLGDFSCFISDIYFRLERPGLYQAPSDKN